MSIVRGWVARLSRLFGSARSERELTEELESHVQMHADEFVRRGHASAEARRMAMARSGGIESAKEAYREQRGVPGIERLSQDVRYAMRTLRRSPGFTIVVVLTLALGIGANTAVFSVVDAVLLHPLPVARPERLAGIYEAITDQRRFMPVAYPVYRALAERTTTFTGIAAHQKVETVVRTHSGVEQVSTDLVTGNYFSVLGLSPQAGRLFVAGDDDVPGAHPLVVLSDALWTRMFNRDPTVVGTTLIIGTNSFTVIGVAPRGFRGANLIDSPLLFVPSTMVAEVGLGGFLARNTRERLLASRGFNFWNIVGRVRDGRDAVAAAADLNAIRAQEERAYPSNPTAQGYAGKAVANPMSVVPIAQAASFTQHDSLVRFLALMAGVVVLTLLIACVNVANLFAVRAGERTLELSVRASLGASRGRIAQQLVVESLVLTLCGAAAGVALDAGTLRVLSAFTLPGNVSLASAGLSLSPRVLVFTIALAVLTALLCGLAPSLRVSRADLGAVLRATGAARRHERGWLLASQVAMSVVLLVGAGLFVRTMRAGLSTDIGFDARPLAVATINTALGGYTGPEIAQYYATAVERVGRIPGVTAVALSTQVPLSFVALLPFVPGPIAIPDQAQVNAGWIYISPNFFDVLGVPLVDGRTFVDADSASNAAIINQSAAAALFPDGHPLGRDMIHAGSIHFTVVGVVRDTKYQSVNDEHVPMVYTRMARSFGNAVTIVARTKTPAGALPELRRVLGAIPPSPPVRSVRLVSSQIDDVLLPQRFGAVLLGWYSLVALTIAAVGIYGMVAYSVNRRRREIGVRIAVGASHGHVARLVVQRVALMVALGTVVGLAGATLATRALAKFLYGVTPLDTTSFVAAGAAMLVAAVLACALPTVRAVRIDPVAAIRTE